MPLPASVPPLCAKTPATLVAASTVSVPPLSEIPPVKALASAMVVEPLLLSSVPALVRVEPAAKTMLPPPVCQVAPLAMLTAPVLEPVPLL